MVYSTSPPETAPGRPMPTPSASPGAAPAVESTSAARIRQVRRKGLRPPEVQGAARRRQKAARLVRQARLQVGAAHVDTDEESAHFCFRLPCSARRSTRWASSWAALKP